MKDLVIIVAVILCLMIIVSLVNNYYNVSEGLESKTTFTPVSPLTLADEISKDKDALVNGLNISANKATYEDILSDMYDYYDALILSTIVNSKKNNAGVYDLTLISKFKDIKDTLQEAKEYIESQ